MSSGPLKSGPPLRAAQGITSGAPSNQTLLLEKINARTTTPDSEALASSDDEGDHRQDQSITSVPPHKPVRRSSWLNDTSLALGGGRKPSLSGAQLSPTTSHPSTPSGEPAGPWGSHSTSSVMGRAAGGNNFPWGTGIWNNDRKDPPSRFSEVLPSPTSTVPPGITGNTFFPADSGLSPTSSGTREPGTNSQIPFAIPLHPTPKTYRSQSYSVGQLDPDTNTAPNMTNSAILGRARHSGLQHRPSRPSMLSEMANDGSMLGKVKEVEDDDDESLSESLQGSFHQSSESKTIEMLARENAMLRQQQHYNARLRPRASTGAVYLGNGYSTVPEEADYAVDELDEANEGGESFARRAANRRMSEYSAGPVRAPIGLESRKTDSANLKKALWSTSLGFPSNDVSQSRRHSFANMPTRQGSISSMADSASGLDALAAELQSPQDYGAGFPDSHGLGGNANAAGFFPGAPNHTNVMPSAFGNAYAPGFNLQNQFANRAPSPHRNVYSMPQPRHNQLLHIVLFKCARADVFYIQEGTGLTVKPGDLVIVEADRGTDLGTVARDNVDWHTAKELKDHYAEEQYKWLMMYSQGAAAAQESTGSGLLASAGGLQGSAIGGMGPPTQHHMQEPNAGELRPKLIKRLAQSHEIHSLRDKEGQEAKAKRVCMQKVKEHGLNMEILDAEFQMDWKKLTFYYFADAYINFNSLVTDLFKIYKTRIWMSAINPASFASPTLGIQAPSGIGPGAVGVNRASSGSERRHNQQSQQSHHGQATEQQPPQAYGTAAAAAAAAAIPPQSGRGYPPSFGQQYGADRVAPPASGYPQSNYGYGQAGAFGVARGNPSYIASAEGFSGVGYPQLAPTELHQIRQRFQGPGSVPSPTPRSQGVSPISPQTDWTSTFQGLSLNTH